MTTIKILATNSQDVYLWTLEFNDFLTYSFITQYLLSLKQTKLKKVIMYAQMSHNKYLITCRKSR